MLPERSRRHRHHVEQDVASRAIGKRPRRQSPAARIAVRQHAEDAPGRIEQSRAGSAAAHVKCIRNVDAVYAAADDFRETVSVRRRELFHRAVRMMNAEHGFVQRGQIVPHLDRGDADWRFGQLQHAVVERRVDVLVRDDFLDLDEIRTVAGGAATVGERLVVEDDRAIRCLRR
jgi:hypothetical protein